MPSASGVYSLPSGYLAVTGQVIQASQHNPPLEDIAAALTLRLSRDGSAPMLGGLQAVAGSAALPGYAFATNTTTGIFKSTNGIGVAVGGAQVAEFTASGLASGVWVPGMLMPWALSTVPNSLWVFPVGQTLSRAVYPTLWAKAQAEIAAGNTFFNNGDGATTFGIGDLRGRIIAALDGGVGRLIIGSGGIGAAGGAASVQLGTGNLPPYTPSGSIVNGAIGISGGVYGSTSSVTVQVNQVISTPVVGGNNALITLSQAASSFIGNAQGGSSVPFSITQPTILLNYIMFAGAGS